MKIGRRWTAGRFIRFSTPAVCPSFPRPCLPSNCWLLHHSLRALDYVKSIVFRLVNCNLSEKGHSLSSMRRRKEIEVTKGFLFRLRFVLRRGCFFVFVDFERVVAKLTNPGFKQADPIHSFPPPHTLSFLKQQCKCDVIGRHGTSSSPPFRC